MLCLEDCAQSWWSGGDGGSGGGGKGGESTGVAEGLCGSSCCSHCTHAVDGLVGLRFHNRSYNVEAGSSGAEVRRQNIFHSRPVTKIKTRPPMQHTHTLSLSFSV
jgi:hypothetical protein